MSFPGPVTLAMIEEALRVAWTTEKGRRSSKPYPSTEQCQDLLNITNLYVGRVRIASSPKAKMELQRLRLRNIAFAPKVKLSTVTNRFDQLRQELKAWQANRGDSADQQAEFDQDEVVVMALEVSDQAAKAMAELQSLLDELAGRNGDEKLFREWVCTLAIPFAEMGLGTSGAKDTPFCRFILDLYNNRLPRDIRRKKLTPDKLRYHLKYCD